MEALRGLPYLQFFVLSERRVGGCRAVPARPAAGDSAQVDRAQGPRTGRRQSQRGAGQLSNRGVGGVCQLSASSPVGLWARHPPRMGGGRGACNSRS
jgi:hypothetical protein